MEIYKYKEFLGKFHNDKGFHVNFFDEFHVELNNKIIYELHDNVTWISTNNFAWNFCANFTIVVQVEYVKKAAQNTVFGRNKVGLSLWL